MPRSVEGVMREFKEGKLHSGSKSGPVVKDRKQAVAIAMSQDRDRKKKKAGVKDQANSLRKPISSDESSY